MRNAALALLRHGFSVFPCGHGSKKPLVEWGAYQAQPATEAQVTAWWTQWPDANIAVVTGVVSGLVVIDADGTQGLETIQRIVADGHQLPHTVRAITPGKGGGSHYFFRHPGGTVSNRAHNIPDLPECDIRGDGGYVVVAPSVHPEGGVYQWAPGCAPGEVELAEIPSCFLAALQAPHAGQAGDGTPGTRFQGVPEGQRNGYLASLAGAMRRRGAAAKTILAALLAENTARCKPPLEEAEVRTVAASVARYDPGDPPRDCAAATTPVVPAERILRFRTAAEIAAETPQEVPWLARPWLALGAITELVGKAKSAGKTTWLTFLLRCVLDGLHFMGLPTLKSPVVYLSEQPGTTFREALKRAGLLERMDLHVLYRHECQGVAWAEVVRQAVLKCQEVGAKVMVVDTITPFAGFKGDGENNAGDAQGAVQPLVDAASAGLCVCVVRHERKGGGEVGESGRGSSAFAGAVDVVLALRRAEGNAKPSVRVIHALSRFSETPEATVIELTSEGYVSHGAQANVALEEAKRAILEVVPEAEESAIPLSELRERVPESVKRTTCQEALKALIAEGSLVRLGKGGRKDPHRYHLSPENGAAGTTILVAAQSNGGAPGVDHE